MQRYATYGPTDSPSISDGDVAFLGVDQFTAAQNLPPGICQDAVNCDFSNSAAETRKGFVSVPGVTILPFAHTWTARTAAFAYSWRSVTYGDGLYVAVSAGLPSSVNSIMASQDGITWSLRTGPRADFWNAVTYGNGLFVAVTSNISYTTSAVMTSPDGSNWTVRTTPVGNYYCVTYANGLFVAGGNPGQIITSPDGITWTARTSGTTRTLQSITYANGLYVAVCTTSGSGDQVITSPDGITWTTRTAAAASTWYSVAYGNGLFVAVGSGNATEQVMTSPDGITWTARTSAYNQVWAAVVFAAGQFVAVGGDVTGSAANQVMVSVDGINWTLRAASSAANWCGLVYGNHQLVAIAGTNGPPTYQVMTSPDTVLWAQGVYSDPQESGSRWVMMAARDTVYFYAFGRTSRTVAINSSYTVTEPSTIVQCNNLVYLFRGEDNAPLYWDGNWSGEFTIAPTPTPSAGFSTIPSSSQATYHQNRLWVKDGKDTVAASAILDFTAFDDLSASFTTDFGSSDYVVTTYPFGTATLLVFKNRSIFALTNTDGAVTDVTATEITRQVGCIGKDAVVSVGPDVVYMSDRNINLLSLTAESNALQHKTLPLSRAITKIFKRVNWNYAYKVSMGYWDNKLYVAVPLDNADACNTVLVYNFLTGQWYGEWNFNAALTMNILGWAVANYHGEQRLYAITEDGRIFVTDEGPLDVYSGNFLEISSSFTTRAYRRDNQNSLSQRFYGDFGTWRPSFSVTAYVDGANEYEEILSDQTFSRSDSWIFNDSTYSLTNSGDNYNRAGRKDYAGLCSESIQAQSGFYPEMLQEFRLPLIFRRKGRTVWFKCENAQGKLVVYGVGSEARAGSRGNLIQVL